MGSALTPRLEQHVAYRVVGRFASWILQMKKLTLKGIGKLPSNPSAGRWRDRDVSWPHCARSLSPEATCGGSVGPAGKPKRKLSQTRTRQLMETEQLICLKGCVSELYPLFGLMWDPTSPAFTPSCHCCGQ